MRNLWILGALLGCFVMGLGAAAGEEQAPFFVGEIFYPNALIIFDNSDSMQDVPYTNPGGTAVRANPQQWQMDVTDSSGAPLRDTSGFLYWATRSDRSQAVLGTNALRRASGGDHPSSKLYQAKQALNAILNPPLPARFENVNLGFATYLSQRSPRVVAKYWALQPGTSIPGTSTTINRPTRWEILVWASRQHNVSTMSPWNDKFTWYGVTRAGGVGAQFTILRTDGDVQTTSCPERTKSLTYTITAVTAKYNPVDGQFLGYQWDFNSPYQEYQYTTINDANYDPGCTAGQGWNICTGGSLPTAVGSWVRVRSGAGCNLWRKLPAETTVITYPGSVRPDIYLFQWYETVGSWSGPSTGQPRYIDRDTLRVTPLQKYTSGGYTYQLMTSTLSNVVINTSGTTATVEPAQYQSDTFSYPADGSANKPHAWSYVRWNASSQWPDAAQPAERYPATLGDPPDYGNIRGDDHIIFVNLPSPNSNDEHMLNRDRILPYISLERYQSHPRYGTGQNIYNKTDTTMNYDYTTMPHTFNLPAPKPSIPPNTTTAVAGKATPLAASLRYAKRYYESYIRQDTKSLQGCRENYIIFLTDGLDTCDCDYTSPDYMDCLVSGPNSPVAAARELYNLQVGGITRRVKTFVVGFGLEESQRDALDAMAQAGGTTQAYFASNVGDLVQALTRIFQQLTAGRYTRSDLAVARSGERLYSAYFNYPGWAGRLKAYSLGEKGEVGTPISEWGGAEGSCPDFIELTDADGNLIDSCAGDAGGSMHDTSLQPTRKIFTTVGSGMLPSRMEIRYSTTAQSITFQSGQLSDIKPFLISASEDINGNGTPNEDADALTVLGFTFDPAYGKIAGTPPIYPYKGTRQAEWLLPDLYHTRPVPVGPPAFPVSWGYYPEFKIDHAGRETVIYVGGNGGMLHAISDSNGTERWAYMPKMALGKLKKLKDGHEFFVDSEPRIADIYSSGGGGTVFPAPAGDRPQDGWHTVLISGMREGGRGYFALEVTDPDNPRVLWEVTDSNMAYTWSVPAVGRVKLGSQDKWVAFVGGGYSDPGDSSENDKGNRLYVIDIETGTILKEWTIGSATNKVPSAIREVDLNKDGYIEAIYFGDLEGVLWKMDLTSTNINRWDPCILLDPGSYNFSGLSPAPAVTPTRRPIFYMPAVAKGDSGNPLVFFGTGDEKHPLDVSGTDFFYEVEDLGTSPGGSPPTCTGRVNWVRVLGQGVDDDGQSMQGEKVLARPSVFNRIVYFTTYVPPPPSSECGVGKGYLYGLTMSSGAASTGGGQAGLYFDLGGHPLVDSEGHPQPVERLTLGAGVPTAPIITNGTLYVTTSNTVGGGPMGVPINPLGGVIRGWREVF
jgi:hypothetical protein